MNNAGLLAVFVIAVVATAACVHVIDDSSNDGEPERIGIIGAMDDEVSTLKNAMKLDYKKNIAGTEFFVGTLGGCDVVIVQSGMVKVNAVTCAQLLIT